MRDFGVWCIFKDFGISRFGGFAWQRRFRGYAANSRYVPVRSGHEVVHDER